MDKKFQKLNLKSFVKETSPFLRLQSIRLPRDLSLGGTKLRKKEYKPNLNVVRNKSYQNNRIEKPSKSRNVRDKLKRKCVQSTGVFSEGIGFSGTPNPLRNETSQRKTEKNEKLCIPSIKKNEVEVDKQSEETIVNEIVRCQRSSESDNEEKSSFEPMNWGVSTESVKDVVKPEKEFDCFSPSKLLLNHFDPEPIFTLWKMPSSLAFKSNLGSSKIGRFGDCNLSELPQGKIGKITIRKSGRVEAFFGDMKYDLESPQMESFYETLVSINIGPEHSEATVLGEINERLILSPDWNYLLTGK